MGKYICIEKANSSKNSMICTILTGNSFGFFSFSNVKQKFLPQPHDTWTVYFVTVNLWNYEWEGGNKIIYFKGKSYSNINNKCWLDVIMGKKIMLFQLLVILSVLPPDLYFPKPSMKFYFKSSCFQQRL